METIEIHPVAQYVFSFIKAKETTEYQLSKRADFSHVTFSNWRKGKVPSTKILEKIQKIYPDFNRNGLMERKDYASISYNPNEQEIEIVRLRSENSNLKAELEKLKISLESKDNAILNLSSALGKSKGMTESLLVDSESGVSLMNAILGSKVGHALSQRMQ